jgi:hypothetical protein
MISGTNYEKMVIQKYSNTGKIQWEYTVNSEAENSASKDVHETLYEAGCKKILKDSQGNFIVVGYCRGRITESSGESYYNQICYGWVAKFDGITGNMIWKKSLSGSFCTLIRTAWINQKDELYVYWREDVNHLTAFYRDGYEISDFKEEDGDEGWDVCGDNEYLYWVYQDTNKMTSDITVKKTDMNCNTIIQKQLKMSIPLSKGIWLYDGIKIIIGKGNELYLYYWMGKETEEGEFLSTNKSVVVKMTEELKVGEAVCCGMERPTTAAVTADGRLVIWGKYERSYGYGMEGAIFFSQSLSKYGEVVYQGGDSMYSNYPGSIGNISPNGTMITFVLNNETKKRNVSKITLPQF